MRCRSYRTESGFGLPYLALTVPVIELDTYYRQITNYMDIYVKLRKRSTVCTVGDFSLNVCMKNRTSNEIMKTKKYALE
jgi:hypothetical protein